MDIFSAQSIGTAITLFLMFWLMGKKPKEERRRRRNYGESGRRVMRMMGLKFF